MAMGEHATLEAVLVLDDVSEIGKDEVDAEHFRFGEHDAAVDQDRPAVHFEPGAVATYLAQATEEDDADRGSGFWHWLNSLPERLGVQVGPDLPGALGEARRGGAHRQAAFACRQTERPQHRLGRYGVWSIFSALELPRLDKPGVQRHGSVGIALRVSGDHLADLRPSPMRGHTYEPDSPDRYQREGEGVLAAIDLEAVRGLVYQSRSRGGRTGRILETCDHPVARKPRKSGRP